MIVNVIMLALFVETIVSALKPLWKADGKGLSVTEIVSVVIGVVLAVACKLDLFSYIADFSIWDSPEWVYYIFYAMSGVAIGRGPSFIYDLWQAIVKWKDIDFTDPLYEDAKKELIEDIKKEIAEETKE